MNIEFCGTEKLNENTLLGALRRIKVARMELHLRAGGDPTPSALVSQIELYNALLGEIRAVRACLGPRSAVARCSRSGRYLAVPRAKERKNLWGDIRQEMYLGLRLPSDGNC
jgi:hypothetical protein